MVAGGCIERSAHCIRQRNRTSRLHSARRTIHAKRQESYRTDRNLFQFLLGFHHRVGFPIPGSTHRKFWSFLHVRRFLRFCTSFHDIFRSGDERKIAAGNSRIVEIKVQTFFRATDEIKYFIAQSTMLIKTFFLCASISNILLCC